MALDKLVRLPDTCVLKGRGRWWERVRNFLGGKNLSTWNVTWKKVLVIGVKVGSSEYSAMIVLRKCPSVLAGSWEAEARRAPPLQAAYRSLADWVH